MPQIFHRLSGQSITQPHFCKTLPPGPTPSSDPSRVEASARWSETIASSVTPGSAETWKSIVLVGALVENGTLPMSKPLVPPGA
jgi:hypothetical protein